MMILFVVLFPLVILFLCLLLAGAGTTVCFQAARFMPFLSRFTEVGVRCLDGFLESGDRCFHKMFQYPVLLFKLVFYIFVAALYVLVVIAWSVIVLLLASIAFAILIVPCYLMLMFLLCRKFYIWSRTRQQKRKPIIQELPSNQQLLVNEP